MNIDIAKKRLSEVIRTDVVTSSQADFLATHVALKNLKLVGNGWNNVNSDIQHMSEDAIFSNYVLNKDNKHQFIIVKGQSGVGKSHLIRWFHARMEKMNLSDEVVLFIRRSDNNLKKTIEQLLAIDAVASIPNKDIIERLVKASNTIDDNKFKDLIYSNFVVELRNDERTDILDNHAKKNFEALLQNNIFQDKLLEESGPIDRICSKVSDRSSLGNNEVVALFSAEDFKVDIDFCDELRRQGADRKALRMAQEIYAKPKTAEVLATYLNRFVDAVIQICAGIEPGDFENVFNEIRKELRKNGKNLTLLIEDITAFTGVNEALLNVLTTEHTGDYEKQEMCRLSSFVGTTIQYYESFQANLVDRVTHQIIIEDNPFGQDENELYEFVARYINAISLPRERLVEWLDEDRNIDSFPVHDATEEIDWEHFELAKGKLISIYPFTFNSIQWLYTILPKKTPRYLLKNVLEIVIKDLIYNKNKFPAFKIPSLPMWNENDGIILTNQITDKDVLERLNKFICVWGNASIVSQEVDGVKYIGGLTEDMYKEFGLPIIEGRRSNQVIKVPKRSKVDVNAKTNEVVAPEVKKNTKEELQYQEEIKGVELWIQGAIFEKFKTVRDNIYNFLMDAIDWQNEGVSYDTIVKFKNSNRNLIEFERQKMAQGLGLVILPADRKTAIVVQAFLSWDLRGKKKWDFPGANYMRYQVESWLFDIKDKLIEKVKSIGKEDVCFEVSAVAEIYRLLLFGQYNGSTLNWIATEALLETKLIEIPENNEHSREWNDLMKNIYNHENKALKPVASHKNTIRYFHNLYQGDIGENYSNRFFYNRNSLDNALDSLVKRKLLIDYSFLDFDEMLPSRKELASNTRELSNLIQSKIVVAEKEKALSFLDKIRYYFDEEEIFDDDITDICNDIREFYKKFTQQQFNVIPKNDQINEVKKACKEISNAIAALSRVKEMNEPIDLLILFSSDPMKRVKKLLVLLETVESDVVRMRVEVTRRREKLVISTNVLRNDQAQGEIGKSITKYEKIIGEMEG